MTKPLAPLFSKTIVPPLKIQGIKTKIVPFISKIAKKVQYNTWIEPFLGSGAVGFNITPNKAIFCDINPHIITFYNAIKNSAIDSYIVREYLEIEGAILAKKGDEYYYEIRQRFNNNHNPLDFLFLNRASFNGIIRFNKKGEFNTPFCKKPNRFSKAYITKIVNQVRTVEILIKSHDWTFICDDFAAIIQKADKSDLIYCDPPYIARNTNYYDTWNENDEKRLSKLLKDKNFILSTWIGNKYRQNEFIKKYWENFPIQPVKHYYHVGGKELNRNTIIEALIYNI